MRFFSYLSFVTLIAAFFFSETTAAATYTVTGDVVGSTARYVIKKKDTLYSIARQFDIGIVEIVAANPGTDVWMPKEGDTITIPTSYVLPTTAHNGIVVDLSELRLFYFPDPYTVTTFPIGIGMDGWSTPTGVTKIVKKREHPTWTAPDSILKANPDMPHFIPAGPDNPLGDYAMNLDWPNYLIHGTNRPYGIGRRSSHGCMRLYPEDISVLFSNVSEGTIVTVIDAPYKLGWKDDTLLLQITPSQQQADEIARSKPISLKDIPQVYGDVHQMAGSAAKIDWRAVHDAVMWRTGIPTAVATREKPLK